MVHDRKRLRMDQPIDTGYEGKEDRPESQGKVWRVKKLESMMGSGTVLQILCNNEPRGILDLKGEDEIEWITKRVSGSQPSSPVSE